MNAMTDYQKERQNIFFISYPAESIRAADIMGEIPDGILPAGEINWKAMRLHEINTMKINKLKGYQETGRWL